MTSRPKHVSSLSDKISGLKFMQRAKAVQDRDQPGPSHSAVSKESKEKKEEERQAVAEEEQDGNDEHWVLPGAAQSKSTGRSASTITYEPGWNAWLDETEGDRGEAGAPKAAAATTTRRLFGAWTRKEKKRKEVGREERDSREPDLDDEGSSDVSGSGEEDEGDESEGEDLDVKDRGFIKPGSSVRPGKARKEEGGAGREREGPLGGKKGEQGGKKRRKEETPAQQKSGAPTKKKAKRP